MTRRLIATYLILAAVVLIALEVPLGVVYERSQRRDLQQRVERDAVALASLVEDALQGGATPGDPALTRVVDRYSRSTGARVVVVGAQGRLLADSDSALGLSRDFSTRPEIALALGGEIASGTRRSDTLGTSLLYVAVPVASGGVVHGAVRASVPTSRLDSLVIRYWLVLGGVALIVLGAVALAGRWLALWVSRPLTRLRDATRRAEVGDLTVRADASAGPAEVRELSGAFNDMISRLDLVVGTQEQFVADASHQLRSPLTALRLRIENLQHEASPAVADDLEGAIAEVDRLSRLVNGLLSLAHADRRAPERTRQEVGELVRERAEAWRFAAAENGIEILASAEGELWSELSPGALEQVLDNLISNALEAAPPQTEVRLCARRAGEGVVVEVSDQGAGMDPEARRHAFDRFWRGAEGRHGSGLGLAIVKSLVEADAGSVALDEAPGGGTRVLVTLPSPRRPAHSLTHSG
jgi:signal transduction histidine kinase